MGSLSPSLSLSLSLSLSHGVKYSILVPFFQMRHLEIPQNNDYERILKFFSIVIISLFFSFSLSLFFSFSFSLSLSLSLSHGVKYSILVPFFKMRHLEIPQNNDYE